MLDVSEDGFAWREHGTGDVVVLLHGLGGSRISWEPQLSGLGSQWRVAAWDMPGYGDAAPLADETLTFAALARAAAEWIERLGVGRAHVVGISMGGMIAQYLAAWHPERVRSLTLLSTSPCFGLDGTDPDEWKAARLAPLLRGEEPVDFAPRVLAGLAGPNITGEALAVQVAAMARITGPALRRSIECLVSHDSRPLLAGIEAPTLVLAGSDDTETPPAYGQYLADHLPHASLAVVAGAGHLLNVEAPDDVNRLITDHILKETR